jgi:hypothetical protein
MTRWIARFIIISSVVATTSAYAQETNPGPGKLEVAVIPGGATFFTDNTKMSEPGFGNYDLGGALAYNFNQMFGVEGEVAGSLGIKQSLTGLTVEETSPNMLSYSGNVVVNAPGRALVPYATGGVGGLTVYDRAELGMTNTDSFLTGNVGGGVKWFSGSGRWGVRGDYRFQVVRSNNDASTFFGQDTRFGHRVYGGVIVNAVR